MEYLSAGNGWEVRIDQQTLASMTVCTKSPAIIVSATRLALSGPDTMRRSSDRHKKERKKEYLFIFQKQTA
jgi:hypothetical protein